MPGGRHTFRRRLICWMFLSCSASVGAMAKPKKRYVCQACGSVSSRWTGQCADCAEWNSLVEDAEGGGDALLGAAQSAQRRAARSIWSGSTPRSCCPPRMRDRHRRVRPGAGRRPRRRLGHPDRRRSRHRQVDPAPASGREDRLARPCRRLYFRRGGGRPGSPARAPARAWRGAAAARGGDLGARHPDHASANRRRRPWS